MLCSTAVTVSLLVLTSLGSAGAPAGGPAFATTTNVAATSRPDGAMTVTVTVVGSRGTPSGTVTVDAGPVHLADLPLDADGRASLTTGALGGNGGHLLTAEFVGSAAHAGSVSAPVMIDSFREGGAAAPANVTVGIPAGALTITSRRDQLDDRAGSDVSRGEAAHGLTSVVVQDTRAGDLGFTVSASVATGGRTRFTAPRSVSLVDVRATQVPGNALRSQDLRTVAGRRSLTGGAPAVVATYPSSLGTGSVRVSGTVLASGVPTGAHRVLIAWTVV